MNVGGLQSGFRLGIFLGGNFRFRFFNDLFADREVLVLAAR